MPDDRKIGFIGGGNLAEAMLKGLLAGGVAPSTVTVSEPQQERREALASRYGITATAENTAVVASSDVIVLAVKPQVASAVLTEIADGVTADKLLVSIMAGITIQTIEAFLAPGTRVVRVMPNTPALVMEAASVLCAGRHATAEDLSLIRRIFELLGKAYVLEEKLLDAVTGLSGSGPAYVFTFIETLSDAGVKNGIPREVATGLAVQTVLGSAKLLLETGEHAALLRERVTSPGGTTIAGVYALEKGGFRAAVMDAVDAATRRAQELGRK